MNKLALHSMHEQYGAQFTDIRGWLTPTQYQPVGDELHAVKNNVALLDRSYLGKVLVKGVDAVDLINRISTNDMTQLIMGVMCDTVFCTPKGRIFDYCRVILRAKDELLLVSSYIGNKHLMDWINRFIILEDATVLDVSADYVWLTLIGPEALAFLRNIGGNDAVAEDETIWLEHGEERFAALLNKNFMVPAYNFYLPKESASAIAQWLTENLHAFGGSLLGDHAFQILRVESGMPDWGTELTEDYNPHEARLLHAVSFTKGCYTGQEVIARLDTYEKVQKYLMICDFDEQLFSQPPMTLYFEDEKVGVLTSYAYDPLSERSIGLGYVKKNYVLAGRDIKLNVIVDGRPVACGLRRPANTQEPS